MALWLQLAIVAVIQHALLDSGYSEGKQNGEELVITATHNVCLQCATALERLGCQEGPVLTRV